MTALRSDGMRAVGVSLAERVARLPERRQAPILRLLDELPADAEWDILARPAQAWPEDRAWGVWLICAGRGWGKTRTGSEAFRRGIRDLGYRRTAIIGRTAADVREVMLEGESGLLRLPGWRPTWEPSKRRLTWPNGATTTTFSADEPDQLRGPEHDLVWGDELATWTRSTYDNVRFGLRIPHRFGPRAIFTTTPRPLAWLVNLSQRRGTYLTTGRYAENRANLAREFREAIEADYAGTALGAQELDGVLTAERQGALWTRALLDAARAAEAPPLVRVVVAVDPAVTATEGSDETGLVVAGVDRAGHLWVLRDASGRMRPEAWARRAVELYREHRADRIVAEANQGGDMVAATIAAVDRAAPVRLVHATRGKAVRAEPVSALYEQGRAHHVAASPRAFETLEDQLCSWAPGDAKSPDRLDALVWAATDLVIASTAVGAMVPASSDTGRDASPWAR